MAEQRVKRIWKIRTVKGYPEANSHILIGEVLEVTAVYVRVRCHTYHFGRSTGTVKDIRVGEDGVRIIPWNRIELVNELPADFDYSRAKLSAEPGGDIVLADEGYKCVIVRLFDSRKI
jgi:hypothetical protein